MVLVVYLWSSCCADPFLNFFPVARLFFELHQNSHAVSGSSTHNDNNNNDDDDNDDENSDDN